MINGNVGKRVLIWGSIYICNSDVITYSFY